jgi:hypothetical protein
VLVVVLAQVLVAAAEVVVVLMFKVKGQVALPVLLDIEEMLGVVEQEEVHHITVVNMVAVVVLAILHMLVLLAVSAHYE